MTRTERTYYLVVSLYHGSWSPLGPVYALFLLSRGLDLFEINLVLATYLITAFLFEVPTGAVADIFGRKLSFVLSCAVRAIAFLLYAFSDSLADFLVAEFIDAIGTTLATGALDAWAVDGMRAEGDSRPPDRIFARSQLLARTVMIASGFLGAYVATYDMVLPWFAGTGAFILTGIVAAVLMQRDRPADLVRAGTTVSQRKGVAATMAEGWRDVRASSTLSLLCLLTLASTFAHMPALHYWQPRMQDLSGQGVSLMGWIFAALNLAAIFASVVVERVQHLPREYVLAAVASVRALMLGVAAVATSFAPALIGLVFFELGFALSEPLFLAWTNEHAEPERRATVLSMRAMSFTFGGGIGLLCMGFLARAAGIPAAWLTSALVVALTVPIFFLLRDGRLVAAPRES